MAARILNEEVEAWFIRTTVAHERDGKSVPSGHFHRGDPGHAPYSKKRWFLQAVNYNPHCPAWLRCQEGQCGLVMPSNPPFLVQLVLPDSEKMIEVSSEQHIWEAALAQDLVLPAMCHQGRCLTCAARLEGRGSLTRRMRLLTS
jgi:hypothetical protein